MHTIPMNIDMIFVDVMCVTTMWVTWSIGGGSLGHDPPHAKPAVPQQVTSTQNMDEKSFSVELNLYHGEKEYNTSLDDSP